MKRKLAPAASDLQHGAALLQRERAGGIDYVQQQVRFCDFL